MNIYREQFNEIIEYTKSNSSAEQVQGRFSMFCDHLQFLTFNATKPEDYPNGIFANSLFITFEIDLQQSKVELHLCGHLWLNNKDKNSEQYKYYAKRGMHNVAEDYGVKKFRKCKFKNTVDLYNKMEKYYVAVMDAVKQYTNKTYPYF